MNQNLLEVVYKNKYHQLLYYAKQFTKEKEAAEDLVQEAAIKCLATKNEFESEYKAFSYLASTIKNMFLDDKKSKSKVDIEYTSDYLQLVEEGVFQGTRKDKTMQRALVAQSEEQLPFDEDIFEEIRYIVDQNFSLPDATAFIMRYLSPEKKTVKQIAEELGEKETETQWRITKITKFLRQLLRK